LPGDQHLVEELALLVEQSADSNCDLVLDMASVKYLTSSHLAKLLKLRKLLVGGEHRLMLCAIDVQVWSTFLVTGLDKIFEFSESVTTGLASLQMAQGSEGEPS
jgi:anti-anti-sigma factor